MTESPEVERISLNVHRFVHLHHPDYSDENGILLSLLVIDGAGGGLHHGTALVACAILADNQWDGWLSVDRHGSRLSEQLDVLSGDNYYSLVPKQTEGATC